MLPPETLPIVGEIESVLIEPRTEKVRAIAAGLDSCNIELFESACRHLFLLGVWYSLEYVDRASSEFCLLTFHTRESQAVSIYTRRDFAQQGARTLHSGTGSRAERIRAMFVDEWMRVLSAMPNCVTEVAIDRTDSTCRTFIEVSRLKRAYDSLGLR